MDVSCIGYALCLHGIKGFIQGCRVVGMQIIEHQAYVLSMRRTLINKFSYTICPVNFGTLLSDFRRALAISWFKSHKNVGSPIALLLCILPEWLPRLGWQRSTDCTNQWGRHCIHTHLRTWGIVKFFINISDFFPVADQGGVLLWGNTPCFLLPRFQFVFFHVCRIVS
jgi:hypothetical protein